MNLRLIAQESDRRTIQFTLKETDRNIVLGCRDISNGRVLERDLIVFQNNGSCFVARGNKISGLQMDSDGRLVINFLDKTSSLGDNYQC